MRLSGQIVIRSNVSLQAITEQKEGRNGVLHRFRKLRSYRDEIEYQNQEEVP